MHAAKVFLALAVWVFAPSVEAASASDYSGFWKTDCGNAFGLQILPSEKHLYSVSFCGPGGCFQPGTYLPNTPIDGDPMYEVISNNEIRLKLKDGGSVAHYKCTSDTHPVLRYPGTGV